MTSFILLFVAAQLFTGFCALLLLVTAPGRRAT